MATRLLRPAARVSRLFVATLHQRWHRTRHRASRRAL